MKLSTTLEFTPDVFLLFVKSFGKTRELRVRQSGYKVYMSPLRMKQQRGFSSRASFCVYNQESEDFSQHLKNLAQHTAR